MASMLWEKNGESDIQCQLCAHACHLEDGKTGMCGVRVNRRGQLISLVQDVVTAVQIDPIEKKPLYHFLPGSRIFSVGSAGCNFHCRFCQNHEIAHVNPHSHVGGRRLTPETIVRLAEENRTPSIAFTYNEPTVFFELLYNAAGLAKAQALRTVLVSNGFMSSAFLQSMSRRIDAINVDLKSFNDDFYRHYCRGRLQPVLENLVAIKKMGWHLEVTTLLIPGVNDSREEIGKIAAFIRDELGNETPWHISAFHGTAEMIGHPSTSRGALEDAWRLGHESGLQYVYTGNIPGAQGSNTNCPQCGTTLIARSGYRTKKAMKNGECPKCGHVIPGVWS